jgi:mannose-6-phosphate isomerase-like protein (cupin superfamily)
MSKRATVHALHGEDGERLRFSDAEFVVKASADTTDGGFTIIEEVAPLDTPLHVHEHEDELFYVLEGDHVFRVGDEEFEIGPGGVVYAPRRVPHAHRRVRPRTGRFLTHTSPAGFENFFRELAEAERAGRIEEAYVTVSRKYGITWL